MKQQDISKQLGSLISQTSGIYNMSAADEAIPSELQEADPLFEINHNDEMSISRNEAYQTMKCIVGAVVPNEYTLNTMIQNQMKLDAYQLGMLYYQQKMNNITIQTSMDVLAKGDTQPRMFEVIDKLQKRASDLSGQITELQNQFRKYYIDAWLDIQSKEKADEDDNNVLGTKKKDEKPKEIEMKEDGSIVTRNTKNMVEMLQKQKIEKAKLKLLNKEEQPFEEVLPI